MQDCKFKQLILDVYREWQKPERTFKKKVLGVELTYKNFQGTLFGAVSRDSFDDIKDIQQYMDAMNPNMFMLNSRVTGQEVEIYDYQLKDYRIEGDILTLELKNKTISFQL